MSTNEIHFCDYMLRYTDIDQLWVVGSTSGYPKESICIIGYYSMHVSILYVFVEVELCRTMYN